VVRVQGYLAHKKKILLPGTRLGVSEKVELVEEVVEHVEPLPLLESCRDHRISGSLTFVWLNSRLEINKEGPDGHSSVTFCSFLEPSARYWSLRGLCPGRARLGGGDGSKGIK